MTTVYLGDANRNTQAYVLQLLEGAAGLEISSGPTDQLLLAPNLAANLAQVVVLPMDPQAGATLQVVQHVMRCAARPILLLATAATEASDLSRCLDAGAVAAVSLGWTPSAATADRQAVLRQLRILAGIRVISRRGGDQTAVALLPSPRIAASQTPALIAVGASTGGPHALERLLGGLPAGFATPIAVVQHITEGYSASLLAWLNNTCALQVLAVRQRVTPQPGCVYFAPERDHLVVAQDGSLSPLAAPARAGHLPSVDVLFESVAQFHGPRGCGVLLTGMGRDGAQGLLAMRRQGGATAAQDEASCTVFGMPAAAIALHAAQYVGDPAAIASWLGNLHLGDRHG